ncbi:MAG: helix-turn-helix domain-containing protein [Parabacteroides sp.]|nr:helix-turn-helix domain-containing protein [Parabacteroides sp.]MDY4758103.1 helix-turn-helix domain-containing protein [Parabacteroides sp.]
MSEQINPDLAKLDIGRQFEVGKYHEGDVLLFNTLRDKCKPSDFVGQYHIHILCHSGKAQFSMSGVSFEIEPGNLVIWQMGSYIDDTDYSPDFDADFLLISRIFLVENNPETVWATKGYIYIKAHPVFPLTEKDMVLCMANFHRFREQLTNKEHLFRREILGKQMQIFLYDLWNIYANAINRQQQLSNVQGNLFNRFIDLVRQYSTQNREVAFYANKLCVNPKYLSRVSRESSGYPASHWINGYATQEIVALLKNPDLTIAEISDRMNFYTSSHFSRYVKNMLGVSPTEYRNKMVRK